MPGGARLQLKPRAAVLVASGQRSDLAARELGVHERTLRRWAKDDEFLARVRAVEAEAARAAASRLAVGMMRASEVVVQLLDHDDPRVRLAAARAVFDAGPRVREHGVLEGRLVELEERAALAGADGGIR